MTSNSKAGPKARRIRSLAAVATALGLIVLTGCGSSSSTSSSAGAPSTAGAPASTGAAPSSSSESSGSASGSLKLETNREGQLEYSTKSLSAKAGNVSIAFTNMAPIGHNMTIESSSGSTVAATPTFQGSTKKLSVNLKPGSYKFFCSVPGHRGAGMEGTITVK